MMTKLTNNPTNQLGKRSREMLTKAFFDLIKKNPPKEIYIKTLCEKAKISRPTFYAHYDVIDDIPAAYFDQWLHELKRWIEKRTEEKDLIEVVPTREFAFDLMEHFYGYWCNEVDLVIRLQKAGYENVIIQSFNKAHGIIMKELVVPNTDLSPFFQNFLQSKAAIVAYELYMCWINTGMHLSVVQLAEVCASLNTYREIEEVSRIMMCE
jgi:AcrR family transcriptional regulator